MVRNQITLKKKEAQPQSRGNWTVRMRDEEAQVYSAQLIKLNHLAS
jgi:hypothetical protein